MLPQRAIDQLEQQQWIDSTSDKVQDAVHQLFSSGGATGQQVKNFLHGTWLGHQLHPVLTDVPIGSWTAALVLDLLEGLSGRDEFGPGADATIAIGLAGAAGAAVTGLTEWSETGGEQRRVGAVHGLLNLGASILYGASLLSRRQGNRDAGRGLALIGYATVLVSSYLGGHLVYAMRVGVEHTEADEAPKDFFRVMRLADLAENEPRRVEADGVPVLLVRQQDQIFALADRCSHMGGPLSEGKIEDCSIRCPWHGSRFALDDGRVLDGPATVPQVPFAVRVRDGWIEVQAKQRGEETDHHVAALDQSMGGMPQAMPPSSAGDTTVTHAPEA